MQLRGTKKCNIPLNVKSPVDLLPLSRTKYKHSNVSTKKSKKGSIEQTRIIKGATDGCNIEELNVHSRPVKISNVGFTGIDSNQENIQASTRDDRIDISSHTVIKQIPDYTTTKNDNEFVLPDRGINLSIVAFKNESTVKGEQSKFTEQLGKNITENKINISGESNKKETAVYDNSQKHFQITERDIAKVKDIFRQQPVFMKDINSERTSDNIRNVNKSYKPESIQITSHRHEQNNNVHLESQI